MCAVDCVSVCLLGLCMLHVGLVANVWYCVCDCCMSWYGCRVGRGWECVCVCQLVCVCSNHVVEVACGSVCMLEGVCVLGCIGVYGFSVAVVCA